jgi:hypothetical protein
MNSHQHLPHRAREGSSGSWLPETHGNILASTVGYHPVHQENALNLISHYHEGYCNSNHLTPQYIAGFIYNVQSGFQVSFLHPIVKDPTANLHVYGKYDGFCTVPEMYALNNVTVHSFSTERYNGEIEGLRYHLGDRDSTGAITSEQYWELSSYDNHAFYPDRDHGFPKPHCSQDYSTQSTPTSQDTYTEQYLIPTVSHIPGYHEDPAHLAVGQLLMGVLYAIDIGYKTRTIRSSDSMCHPTAALILTAERKICSLPIPSLRRQLSLIVLTELCTINIQLTMITPPPPRTDTTHSHIIILFAANTLRLQSGHLLPMGPTWREILYLPVASK